MTSLGMLVFSLLVVSAGLLVAGVAMLAGMGWSFISAGLCCAGMAALIMKGMRNG